MDRIRAILSKGGTTHTGLERIANEMQLLIPHSNEILGDRFQAGVPLERGLNLIYVDDSGLTFTWGVVVPEEPTPIHSHGTWGVVAVFRGRDRYQIWTRDDQSEGVDPAIVWFINERILETRHLVVFQAPPQDASP